MRLGTETLLTYNVQISFTNKPTNLTFYSNSEKTNAIIIENGNQLVLDGFMSLSDNKKRNIPIYWDWPLETGSSQSEIDENDVIDSNFMGKTMSMQIATTGKQVTENPLTTQYAVTFDANGGTLQGYGNSSQVTKMVTYGETYGNLPRPTKEGYTFVGWSRNLADEIDEQNYTSFHFLSRTTNEFRNDGNFAGLTNQSYIRINGNSSNSKIDTMWEITGSNFFKVTAGKKYILSFYARSENAIDEQGMFIHPTSFANTRIEWNDGSNTKISKEYHFTNDGQWHLVEIEFIVPDGKTSGRVIICNDLPNLYGTDSYIDIANIQFAEDSSTTPYYIDTDTIVQSSNNHILIAKWINASE